MAECGAPFEVFGRVRVYCNEPWPCENGHHTYDSPSGFTIEWTSRQAALDEVSRISRAAGMYDHDEF